MSINKSWLEGSFSLVLRLGAGGGSGLYEAAGWLSVGMLDVVGLDIPTEAVGPALEPTVLIWADEVFREAAGRRFSWNVDGP